MAPDNSRAGPSRSRRLVLPEEDATKLQFGDFGTSHALTPTDVKILLEAAAQAQGVSAPPNNKVYKAAAEYVDEFAQLSSETQASMKTEITAQMADKPGFLNMFEIAQILQLQPQDRGTAVALIPSLERYKDEEDLTLLTNILEAVRNVARYGSRA